MRVYALVYSLLWNARSKVLRMRSDRRIFGCLTLIILLVTFLLIFAQIQSPRANAMGAIRKVGADFRTVVQNAKDVYDLVKSNTPLDDLLFGENPGDISLRFANPNGEPMPVWNPLSHRSLARCTGWSTLQQSTQNVSLIENKTLAINTAVDPILDAEEVELPLQASVAACADLNCVNALLVPLALSNYEMAAYRTYFEVTRAPYVTGNLYASSVTQPPFNNDWPPVRARIYALSNYNYTGMDGLYNFYDSRKLLSARYMRFSQARAAASVADDNLFSNLDLYRCNDLSVVPMPTGSDFGMNVHLPSLEMLQTLKSAGVGIARVDFAWADIEPTQGVFNWSQYDAVVDQANSLGIQLLPIIGYAPSWASGVPGSTHYPAVNPTDWYSFVNTIVTRYMGQGIHYWSLWNEPNTGFYLADVNSFITQIQIPGAQAVRDADPTAQIVGPELSTAASNWSDWLTTFLLTVGDKIDILSVHAYNATAGADYRQINGPHFGYEGKTVDEVMSHTGFDYLPVWLTETGWNTTTVSEDTQATNIGNLMRYFWDSRNIDKIFIYQLLDYSNDIGWGMFEVTGAPKPAWQVIQTNINGWASGN